MPAHVNYNNLRNVHVNKKKIKSSNGFLGQLGNSTKNQQLTNS
jgi:hypothetical protein